jgi:hypothetical protein
MAFLFAAILILLGMALCIAAWDLPKIPME